MTKFNPLRIGVTGHQLLQQRLNSQEAPHTEELAWQWVEGEFAALLSKAQGQVVISCLAAGADQRLTRAGLEHGTSIEVILASKGYEETFDKAADRQEFEHLLARASAIFHTDYPEPSEEAYYAAGKMVVQHSDLLVAVWDGLDAVGLGGTGDVVAYARDHGRDTLHLDPIRRSVHWLKAKE